MKKLLIALAIIVGVIFVGCNREKEDVTKIFSTQVAKEKAVQYVYRIQNNDLEGANDISTKELASQAKLTNNMMPIVASRDEKVTEVNNGAYVEVNVIRSSEKIPKCTMDKWIVKVEKNDKGEYRVSEVKSNLLKDVIAKDGSLYLIDSGSAQREVVTRLSDLPGVLYPEEESVMINKNKIPKKSFQTLGLNFNGDKISFSTTDGKNCFVGVALLDSVKAVFAESKAVAQEVDPSDLKEIFDKPIAKKIVYCDIIKDARVGRFIFAEEGNSLVVEYIKNDGSRGVNIYGVPAGILAPLNLDKIFPLDKYVVKYLGSVKSNILINVLKKDGVNGINQELLGEYFIDLKTNSIDKV